MLACFIECIILTLDRYDLADVHVLEFNTTGGEDGATLQWNPELAISTWSSSVSNYIYNPAPTTSAVNDVTVTTQMHLSGKSHATAYVKVNSDISMYVALFMKRV